MPAQIIINQATLGAGTAGQARSDGVVSQLVTCTNATAEASYLWTLVDVPIRSALVRGTTGAAASFTFTPDVKGTYLVSLRVNGSAAAGDNDVSYIAVRSYGSKTLGWRYNAAGETTEDNETYAGLNFPSNINPRGWSTNEDLMYEEMEESVWETQNGLTSFAGVMQRLVYTDPLTGRISPTLVSSGPPSGVAGGDLSGTYPNPTVAAIQGRAVQTPLIPSNGDTLVWNSGTSQFEPGAGGVTDHGALTGLADDDHLQYLLVNGTRAMTGALQLTDGTLGAPGAAFASELDTGIYRPAADQLSIVASGVAVALFQAPGGANPQLVVTSGTAANPSIKFGTSSSGFHETLSQIRVVYAGTARWAFGSNVLYAVGSGISFIQSQSVNSGLTIGGRQDNAATSTSPSILFNQYASAPFIGNNIAQKHVRIESIVNQTGTSAFSAFEIDTTNTALGSGAQYFLNLQVAGTTVAGITNGSTAATQGRFLSGDGAAATPSLSFLSTPTSGLYLDGSNIAWTVASTKRGAFSSTGITWGNNSSFVISNGSNNHSLTLTGRYDTGAGPSVILNNAVNFVASAATEQTLVSAQINVAQSGSGGYTVLNIQATETSLGSGEKYLIRAKSGPANEQRFAVDYRGNILFSSTRQLRDHTTSPEGVVTAPVGSICVVEDTSVPMNNGVWAKYAGSGSSGWNKLNHFNPLEVYGFEDFDRGADAWQIELNVNAGSQLVSNGAPFFPGSGLAILFTAAGGSADAAASLPTAGMALGPNAPIVTEWKFLPFEPMETAPTAPGATSALTDSSTAGMTEVLGVPALTGEGDAPFWVVLDNGVDPAETRRVVLRAGSTLYISGTLSYSYAPGDTAAYAGPADQDLVYANDEFTWLLGLKGGQRDLSPLVAFGGLWDNGSSTMTNAIAMVINGSIVVEPFTMPTLTAAYYRARLTVAETQVVLEMADGEGPYAVVATYAGAVTPVVYYPIFTVSDGDADRGLVIDWVRWNGLRSADNAIGSPTAVLATTTGRYIPTFYTTGGGTSPSMVGGSWYWTRAGNLLTVSGRFSSVDDAGVATGDLLASFPFYTYAGGSGQAIGSCVGRDFGGNPYVCLVTANDGGRFRIENFPYDATAAVEWWITFTYVLKA